MLYNYNTVRVRPYLCFMNHQGYPVADLHLPVITELSTSFILHIDDKSREVNLVHVTSTTLHISESGRHCSSGRR